MRTWMIASLTGLLSIAQPGGQPPAQEGGKPAQKATDPEQMQKYMQAGAPGEMHRLLNQSIGSWEAKTTAWMTPGAPPQESTGFAVVTGVMSGRFTRTAYTGSLGAMPFMGEGLYGYNNATRSFESTWIDSMTTGMLVMKGAYDAAKKELTWTGSYTDPIDAKVHKVRSVERTIDADTRISEMYGEGPDGKEFKTLEIRYSRAELPRHDDAAKSAAPAVKAENRK